MKCTQQYSSANSYSVRNFAGSEGYKEYTCEHICSAQTFKHKKIYPYLEVVGNSFEEASSEASTFTRAYIRGTSRFVSRVLS